MFFERAAAQLRPYAINLGLPLNARPHLTVTPEERELARAKFNDYPRPWIFICPASQYYNVRSVPDRIWQSFGEQIDGTGFWIGLSDAPKGIFDLKIRTLDTMAVWLSAADLLVSVDTGPLHLAAAMGTPALALGQSSSPELHLSDQVDFQTIWPDGLDCLNCQRNKCPKDPYMPPCQNFDPAKIAARVKQRFAPMTSAVIPIFRPHSDLLNECIKAVVDQVDEVIITKEAAGLVPPGTIEHPKIRHVTARLSNIGFGRNVNFGVRHSNG